jgi:phospholipid/cholesterol/gamma-HCH transport system substrate-binding protein
MSRRTLRKSLLAQLMMFALTISGLYYVGVNVLGQTSATGSIHVKIVAPTSGGMYPKSEVTYRGVRVGTVTRVTPLTDRVEIDVDLKSDARVPADTHVRMTYLSPIGEQMVEFRPLAAGPPYLTEGAVLKGDKVTTSAPFSKTLVLANDVLTKIQPDDLHTIVDESYQAFNGRALDMSQTIDDSDQILANMEVLTPRIHKLLEDSRRPLATLNNQTTNLKQFADAAAQVMQQVRASRRDLIGLIDDGLATTKAVDRFLAGNGPEMTRALNLMMPTLKVISAEFPSLRALLSEYPRAMASLTAVLRHGYVDAIAVVQGATLCRYDQKRRDPWDTRELPIYNNSACPNPNGTLERGWQNAGRG